MRWPLTWRPVQEHPPGRGGAQAGKRLWGLEGPLYRFLEPAGQSCKSASPCMKRPWKPELVMACVQA